MGPTGDHGRYCWVGRNRSPPPAFRDLVLTLPFLLPRWALRGECPLGPLHPWCLQEWGHLRQPAGGRLQVRLSLRRLREALLSGDHAWLPGPLLRHFPWPAAAFPLHPGPLVSGWAPSGRECGGRRQCLRFPRQGERRGSKSAWSRWLPEPGRHLELSVHFASKSSSPTEIHLPHLPHPGC